MLNHVPDFCTRPVDLQLSANVVEFSYYDIFPKQLPNRQCFGPLKAEVTRSNRVGYANIFNNLVNFKKLR